MAWNYCNWVLCNVLISIGIFLVTMFILAVLLHWWKNIFFSLIAKIFKIEHHFLDAQHQIIPKKSETSPLGAFGRKAADSLRLASFFEQISSSEEFRKMGLDTNLLRTTVEKIAHTDNIVKKSVAFVGSMQKTHTPRVVWDNDDEVNGQVEELPNEKASPETNKIEIDDPSHAEHKREVLNIYGKILPLNKIRNKIYILILTTTIISSVLVAAFNALILVTETVYADGPCPYYGPMECFYGNDHTYFNCSIGGTVTLLLDVSSGVCFRWIARDITISEFTTQLGVSTGFLLALSSTAECLIRLYLHALNKRSNVANGIHRMMAKTVCINGTIAPTNCCCCSLPCHCSAFNIHQYKSPTIAILLTGVYISMPILIFIAGVFMYSYKLSVTAYTFICFITFALMCILALVWIVMQHDERSVNVPGGWEDVKTILNIGKDLVKSAL